MQVEILKKYTLLANASFNTVILRIPRRLMGWINKDLAIGLFGGETLIVLAKE
jgi:hypothetical protein